MENEKTVVNEFRTSNEYGDGVLKSWASILDGNTREKAEQISRVSVVKGHVVLMPDAHFGYGPPVGTAMMTQDAIIPYAVGVDIGCGMIAVETNLRRGEFINLEGQIHGAIRGAIPSGVGTSHDRVTSAAKQFIAENDPPPGLNNPLIMEAALQKRHSGNADAIRLELKAKVTKQFGTLGAGNHFVEVCEDMDNMVWLVLHSGSRGVGNVLATAHAKRAKEYIEIMYGPDFLEDPDFAWFNKDTEGFIAYIDDMLWCQKYAYANRTAMMDELLLIVMNFVNDNTEAVQTINCHHNYAEEVEEGVWLTRKGAINAEKGRMGVIPGSMGASTYIVRGLGNADALNTSPHGAGRVKSRGAAKRELDIDAFKQQMEGKTWQDRDASKLLDEAPDAYKDIEIVMNDSRDLVAPQVRLSQFINMKGL